MQSSTIIDFVKEQFPSIHIEEKSTHYVLPTICHNHSHSTASRKLYLYKNEEEGNPLFHCFTQCGETFNIYQLIQKYHALDKKEITYRDAYKMFHGKDPSFEKDDAPQEIMYEKEFKNPLEIYLPEYSKNVLDMFRSDDTDPWAEEGIYLSILEEYGITYSKSLQSIFIPQYDWRGRFIGLRVRTTNAQKEKMFKYMPAHLNNIFYRHPLSLNLYGIWENQKEIREQKKVWIYESEKSCLLHYLLTDNRLALATCGSSISKWQMDMLIHYLGVEEVIIAYDKEYANIQDAFRWIEKIKEQFKYLTLFVKVGIMVDQAELFAPKDSPVDRGIEEFESMLIYYI